MTPIQAAQALPKLEQAAADGNRDAALLLAGWHLGGQLVPRDLARARAFYERAAALGHEPAAMVAVSWLAGGTGGPGDWPTAIERLRDLARTNRQAEAEIALIETMSLTPDGYPAHPLPGETISEAPVARCFRKFATKEECPTDRAPRRTLSRVAEIPQSRASSCATIRPASRWAFAARRKSVHAATTALEAASPPRCAMRRTTQILICDGRGVQPTLDAERLQNQRSWTFLVYLNDECDGGETRFLASGLEFKGRRGDALVFSNVDTSGNPDPASEHAGLPVSKGTKWLLSRWIRAKPIDLGSGAAARPLPSR